MKLCDFIRLFLIKLCMNALPFARICGGKEFKFCANSENTFSCISPSKKKNTNDEKKI